MKRSINLRNTVLLPKKKMNKSEIISVRLTQEKKDLYANRTSKIV